MLQFMKNKILIPLLIGGALAAFFSFKYIGGDDNSGGEQDRRKLVLQTVMKTINEGHYSPRAIDDTFSSHVYHKIMDDLDFEKKFFTQGEMNGLQKYEFQIDDEINANSLEFFDKLNGMFAKSIDRAEGYYKEILNTPFTFTDKQEYVMSGDKLQYAADENALKDRWKQYLKYRVLVKYVDLKDAQKKALEDPKVKDTLKVKTDAQLEADARVSVRQNQERYFKRLRKIDENQRFSIFMDGVTHSEDPHTDYFPPKEKQDFDVQMSGTFFGIGAQLKPEDGKVKVAAIISGSPSWKQGDLKAGDEIQKVGQGAQDPVDVQGYDLDEVVALIRGKKGTEVRLTVKRLDGSMKVIPIIRGEVQIEETFAKSALINNPGGQIGYIYLPEFYSDFQRVNGRRCAEDVANEIQKLKAANVKGIILDLRYNGGGSLSDVVDMAGLFIDKGPIVQVKSNDAAPMKLQDNEKGALYAGPLAIMVNEGSASASEIMAAAMQDYKRAVIVGTPTYGKGTVQKVISLDEMLDPITRMRLQATNMAANSSNKANGLGQLGALKITVQKFYRINGGSTQLKGVTPDVLLPDPYAEIDMGERRDKCALPWDEIAPAEYEPFANPVNGPTLAALSATRVKNNAIFGLIQANATKLKKQQDDNTAFLDEADYRKELDEANTTSKKLEELQKKGTPLTITNLQDDMKRISADSITTAKNNDWIKNLKKDIYLSETVNIINDLSKQSMNVTLGKSTK
ncbi:tail-specific protease [Taibaiella soli]|uniref:Tail-specific protease n=2 Tax=Taibaiella soli TaxID=1649169 RepID=A0A2W2AZT7_9BACT|nr:tail-specific protease [Taibaiella soli]